MNIEVKIKKDDIIEKWEFYFIGHTIYLNKYTYSVIELHKRKSIIKIKYDRLMGRESNITTDEVPLPEDVKKEALRIFVENITVKKWDRD